LKKNTALIYLTLLLVFLLKNGFSQSFTAVFNVVGQPKTYVKLGTISGDNFVATDSVLATNEKIQFSFPENAKVGVYRIIFGKTTYARVMNEAPQYLDFIFNNENVVLNTHFKYPMDSAKIVSSKENALWYSFLKYEQDYEAQYAILEKELDLLWAQKDTIHALDKSNEFNRLQMARDLYIGQQAQQNVELLAAKIIYQFRKPILDGYLNADERKDVFQKYFFKTVDFSDERLLNSAVYTDKVFEYLITYNNRTYTQQQREAEYIKAVDIILENTKTNKTVHQFIIDYLIHGFEVLNLEKVISYINENYN
jgi:hypothetical protein